MIYLILMPKTIIIASSSCGPCVRLVTLLEVKGVLDGYDIVDMELEEDFPILEDIMLKNPDLLENHSPQCVVKKDDGTYGPCDIERLWIIAESAIPERSVTDLD